MKGDAVTFGLGALVVGLWAACAVGAATFLYWETHRGQVERPEDFAETVFAGCALCGVCLGLALLGAVGAALAAA